jgi:hypothetical protein
MRYTKAALLFFGFGILLGLAVVAADFGAIERVASAVMALALVLLPVALIADGRAFATLRLRRKPAKARRTPARRRAPARRSRR